MLEAQASPPGHFRPCFEEISDEGLSVLPRHTKVIVTGNNRTKSVLVGLHGVVKKAVGLGGWHWLVLTNGDEVKLQRNALSVIGPPTGNEDDDVDNPFSSAASVDEDDFPRSFKPRVRPRKPTFTTMSSAGNTTITSASTSQGKESAPAQHQFDPRGNDFPRPRPAGLPLVDLSKLETAALKRYRRHFKLVDVGPNSTKEQLLRAVGRHFVSQQLDELQVLSGFMQAAKRLKAVVSSGLEELSRELDG